MIAKGRNRSGSISIGIVVMTPIIETMTAGTVTTAEGAGLSQQTAKTAQLKTASTEGRTRTEGGKSLHRRLRCREEGATATSTGTRTTGVMTVGETIVQTDPTAITVNEITTMTAASEMTGAPTTSP